MGRHVTLPEDSVIIKEGGIHTFMYMVIKGNVVLYMNYGKEDEYVLGAVSKGMTFGEIGLLMHEPSLYTAVSFSDVELARFSEFELGTFIKGYPEQALGIMRSIARINSMLNMNCQLLAEELSTSRGQINDLENKLSTRDKKEYAKAVFNIKQEENKAISEGNLSGGFHSDRLNIKNGVSVNPKKKI